MGASRAEFLRLLPRLLADYTLEASAGGEVVSAENGRLKIMLGAQQERRIASLVLPILPVTLVFQGYSETEMTEFVTRFEHTYRRGGG